MTIPSKEDHQLATGGIAGEDARYATLEHSYTVASPGLVNKKGTEACSVPTGASCRTRTYNPLIKSQLLYQLS